MLLGGQFGAHVLFTLPELPLPDGGAGHPHRRAGVGSRACSAAAVRRAAPGHAADLRRRRQRAGRPEAAAEGGAGRAARGWASPSPSRSTVAPQLVESGQRVRRARRLRGESLAALRAGAHGACCPCSWTRSIDRCCWPPRWTGAATAAPTRSTRSRRATHRRARAGRARRHLLRHLRAARRHHPARARLPMLLGRRGVGVGRARGRRPPRAAHPLPARPVATPEWAVAGDRRSRGRDRRDHQQRRRVGPEPVAAAAAVARACRSCPRSRIALGLLPAWLAPPVHARRRGRLGPAPVTVGAT